MDADMPAEESGSEATGEGPARFVNVTPAGCYHATESPGKTPERERLTGLLRRPESPALDALEAEGGEEAVSVATLREAGFVTLGEVQERLPQGNLSDLLPTLLPSLSASGRVVLTESRQGLFLDYAGFSKDEAEELAVLASGLRTMADRRSTLLVDRLGIASRAFAIVDPAGGSELGFWPLHVGHNVFTLTILGIPLLNNRAFRTLVWVLSERYGETGVAAGP